MELNQLIDTAIKASLEAGKIILKIYYSDKFEIETKKDNTPVTLADKKADVLIHKILKATKLPVQSEEGANHCFQERKNWKLYWLVDPLDGTKEFIARTGDFTVNIALIKNGIPIAGIIYAPESAELYVGISGLGSYKYTNPCLNFDLNKILSEGKKLPTIKHKSKKVIAISRTNYTPQTESFVSQIVKNNTNHSFIKLGSSKKLAQIAEGVIDIYPRFGKTMEWDTAAGYAILIATGKNIFETDLTTSLLYNKENLTNPNFVAL